MRIFVAGPYGDHNPKDIIEAVEELEDWAYAIR
jgi:hypothetical protein